MIGIRQLYHCRKVLRLYTGIRHTGGASVCLPLDEQTLVPPCVWDRPFSPYTFRQWYKTAWFPQEAIVSRLN